MLLVVVSRDVWAAGPASGVSSGSNGRVVAFDSTSAVLVRGDTNGVSDVFVRDRRAGTTERVSIGGRGVQADGRSSSLSVSGDGRVVAFSSAASNLVAIDTNGAPDVFVRDRAQGMTELVSVGWNGAQGNLSSENASLSTDGRLVAFDAYASNLTPGDVNGEQDVFLRDRVSGTTQLISIGGDGRQGDGHSYLPSVSGDGRVVAFQSEATNLVDGDRNGRPDVFVRDHVAGTTEAISVTGVGRTGDGLSEGPAMSANGRFVAFSSQASDLVAADTNRWEDVFVRDRVRGVTERISVSTGRVEANGWSSSPAVSADGRLVAFLSDATNLVVGDTNGSVDVFVRDRRSGTTRRISVGTGGAQADDGSWNVAISPGGRVVVFDSQASNLVSEQGSYDWEVYAHDLVERVTEQVSVPTTRAVPGTIRVSPAEPRAGRRMTVSVPVTQGGRPVLEARVSCRARAGARGLGVATRGYGAGVARCTWSLPVATAGKVVRGQVAAATPNGAVRRSFEVRVR